MLVVPGDASASHEDKFDSFMRRYPTPESRFAGAVVLADPSLAIPPEDGYYSRNFLLAHWGEEPDQLSDLAGSTYNLKAQLKENVNQPVLALTSRNGASPRAIIEDVKSNEGWLDNDLVVDFGVITSAALIYGFNGIIKETGPQRMGLRPPYLGLGLLLPVKHHQRAEMDVLGDCSVTDPAKVAADRLPVYLGTVPLKFNREAYRQRRIKSGVIVIGAPAVKGFIKDLSAKNRSPQAQNFLGNLL